MRLPEFCSAYRKLPTSIYVLFLARIVNSLGNFVYPFLALILTRNQAEGVAKAGFFVMLTALASAPGALIGGKLADHIGPRKVIIGSMFLAALSFLACAFIENITVIAWLLVLAGFFNGSSHPVSNALVANLTGIADRKAAFSLLYLGINIGSAIGPLIAGFLYNHYFKLIFIGDAATTLVAVILMLLFVPESCPNKKGENPEEVLNEAEEPFEGNLFELLYKRPVLVVFAFILFFYNLVYSQHSFSLPLLLRSVFGQSGPSLFGTLMTTNALVVTALTIFITGLTLKYKPTFNVAWAGFFYAIGFGMLWFIQNYWLFHLSTIIWTLGEILVVTNAGVYIAAHTPASHRGRMNSTLFFISGAGFSLGPLIAGFGIKNMGIRPIWGVVFGVAAAACLSMSLLYMGENNRRQRVSIGRVS